MSPDVDLDLGIDLGDPTEGSLTAAGVASAIALVLLLAPLGLGLPGNLLVFLEVAVLFVLYGLLVLGLNLHFGHTGLVNFGHVMFFALGAYTTAILAAENPFAGTGLGLPLAVAVPAGIVVATLAGVLIGATSLRLRDDFLAMATLAAAEILHALLSHFTSITGGSTGILGVPQPIASLAGSAGVEGLATLLLFGAVLAVAYAAVHRLTRAPYGRVLRAVRADELVTEAVGKPVGRYKMESFVGGAALAGLAGGLFALYNGAVAPGFFTLNVTVVVWIGMLLGGSGVNWAVLVGLAGIMSLRLFSRFLLGVVPVTQSQFASIRLMLVGLVLVAIVHYRPAGLWGNPQELEVDQ